MELQAAVLGTRLAQSILAGHSLNITKRILWSDSTTVLQWIWSEARNYKVFVAHRISEILEATDMKEWRYVPTAKNVADEATKRLNLGTHQERSHWLGGPEFLYRPEVEWPKQPERFQPCQEEIKRLNFHRQHPCQVITNLDHFSNWWVLLRTVARVRRFIWNCRLGSPGKEAKSGPLRADELKEAEILLIQQIQNEQFAEEIELLKAGDPILPQSSLYQLSPVLENGILKISGRIDAAPGIPDSMKRPIILPRNHRATQLLVMSFHRRFHHCAHETVVNEIRQQFHIPKIRVVVQSVKKGCQMCKIARARPEPPEMAPLPQQRITPFVKPFTFTGVDLFGPIDVTIGRRTEKRWGAIFTCLVVRAVHIELIHDLTADAFLLALRNFLNRRGKITELWSDNGRNFTRADKELQKALQEWESDEEINTLLAHRKIKWRFITPGAPHHGGAWESLVKVAKKVIRALLTTRAPKLHTLNSFMIEAEGVMNARPLTHVPVDKDSPTALTPNHFLFGTPGETLPPGKSTPQDELSPKQWRFSQMLADHFWRRFIKEYLPNLTRRTKWFKRAQPLQVNDIVVIVDPGSPRNTWKMGKVIDVVKGRGNQVRSATVKTAHGTYKRPATSLAALDVEATHSKTTRFTGGGTGKDGTMSPQ